jgi:hypothetical protein
MLSKRRYGFSEFGSPTVVLRKGGYCLTPVSSVATLVCPHKKE